MIIGDLEHLDFYASLFPKCKKGFDFLKTLSASMEDKKYELEDGIWGTLYTTAPKAPQDRKLETHNDYIDIQFVIEGYEVIGMKTDDFGKVIKEYDKEKDITFFDGKPDYSIKLNKGEFVLIFPNEAHAPASGEDIVKKAVVKVRLDLLK
jgi:YhcH/YjgK/YiaL family protein